VLTDALTAALRAATENQPFTPDPGIALTRARRKASRRRAAEVAGVAMSVALVAAGLPSLLAELDRGNLGPSGTLAGAGPGDSPGLPSFGALPFQVEEDRAAEAKPGGATCALQLVLGPDFIPARIGLPCDPAQYDPGHYAASEVGASAAADPEAASKLWGPFSRQDYVIVKGRRRLVTSGTAPHGTVSVTAADASGRQLSATLVRPGFTSLVVFAMQSDGKRVTGLHYVLADGSRSEAGDVSTP